MKMDKLLHLVPFLLFLKGPNGLPNGRNTPLRFNTQRIIEAVIIAVIAGAFSGYISVAKLEVKVEGHVREVQAIEKRLCDDNARQEKRIDDNLMRLERMTDVLMRVKK
jgi:hypothetical protein